MFRLGVEAHRLGLAYEYAPFFSLSIARVDPLPHQLEAVYSYFLKLPRIRFLLADDPGAGKTVMAGLLLKELKARGLIRRVLSSHRLSPMINKTNQHTETRSPNGQQKPTLPRIQEALNLAAQDAVELHREHGLPLAVWQDGKTAHISAASVKLKATAKPKKRG